MAEVELAAQVTADISQFVQEMEAAVAIAQTTAGNLTEAFARVASDDSLKNLPRDCGRRRRKRNEQPR